MSDIYPGQSKHPIDVLHGDHVSPPVSPIETMQLRLGLKPIVAIRRPGFSPWVGKSPWRRERLPTPVFWPREFHAHLCMKCSFGISDFLEEISSLSHSVVFLYFFEMATHSSVLAWRIPGTEEPSGLPSMGSHRVRHD